jgi:OPA family glycerol-3-phosphate transporter-like MFS transporter 1/2
MVAERVNLRFFLSMGMILAGVFTFLFGLGRFAGIHNIGYYIGVQGSML